MLGTGHRHHCAFPLAYLLFDDTVADKNYSHSNELVRRQYSGNTKRVIKGIGIVTCVYVNPETLQFRIIDYHIYEPATNGKTELNHVREEIRCGASITESPSS
ncbi:MAG: hypothetical protein M3458_14560 [Acidobacteriota bacterium]|nr:hypothetical protein [Acidobacteriota bacterium]